MRLKLRMFLSTNLYGIITISIQKLLHYCNFYPNRLWSSKQFIHTIQHLAYITISMWSTYQVLPPLQFPTASLSSPPLLYCQPILHHHLYSKIHMQTLIPLYSPITTVLTNNNNVSVQVQLLKYYNTYSVQYTSKIMLQALEVYL